MSDAYRVAIADVDVEALLLLQSYLVRAGHEIVAEAANGDELIRRCRETKPDLVVTDIKLKGIDGLAAIAAISETQDIPCIVVSEHLDDAVIEHASACRVFGVLVKPIRELELAAMIVVVARRFHEFQLLGEEASSTRKALDDRKFIEQAKGILMKKCALDEPGAFRHLQKIARQHRQKVVDVAKSILLAEAALNSHL